MSQQRNLKELKQKLNINSKNNKLRKQLDAIENFASKEVSREDPVDLRRGKTQTNNELADLDISVDSCSETTVTIPNNLLDDFTDELKSIKNLAEKLNETCDDRAYELSQTYEEFYNSVYAVADELGLLFDRRKNKPVFVLKCRKNINEKRNVTKKDISKLSSSIEELKSNIEHIFSHIQYENYPNESIVKDEIIETEAKRMEQEMEYMEEYMHDKDI